MKTLFHASMKTPSTWASGLALAVLLGIGAAGPAIAETATTTTASASPNPALDSEDVTIHTVTEGLSPITSGSLTFREGATDFATVSVVPDEYVSVAASEKHSCGLTAAGSVQCWGYNGFGQLGDGFITAQFTPETIIASGATAIAAGLFHSCAIVSGAVECWGTNGNGQLGDGTNTQHYTPATVIASGATAIAAGTEHTCAIVSGSVQCWGDNSLGQLGDGTTTDSLTPETIIASGATAIAAGSLHSCAVVSGAVECWGANSSGQIGDGTTTASLTPVTVVASSATAVAAGNSHSCAVVSGAVQCWGDNSLGQIGDGSTTDSLTPVTVIASGASAVDVGTYHSCAIVSGAVWCWGANNIGQIGDGSGTERDSPVMTIASGATAIASGAFHSCAVVSGNVRCWGYNSNAQIGDGTRTTRRLPVAYVAFGRALATTTHHFGAGSHDISAAFAGTATHAASTSATIVLTVKDTVPPTLSVPSDITVSTDAGLATAVVNFAAATASDDVDGPLTPTQTAGLASGSAFPVGFTTVTFSATDAAGNQASASFKVKVVDQEAPVVTVPSDITVSAEPGLSNAVVNFAAATATDNVDGSVTPTQTAGLASGSSFPVGKTTVTFKATDAAGNEGVKSFHVTVVDNEAPVVNVPADITALTNEGESTALVSYGAATATDNVDGALTPVRTAGLASGSAFPVGKTTVTFTATDAAGNSGSASFTVTVSDDHTPPKLTLPADVRVAAEVGHDTAVVTYSVSATDTVDGPVAPVLVDGLASGSAFPLGTTTVTYTATDVAGNMESRSFTVKVLRHMPDGGNGNDNLLGSSSDDFLSGGGGNDTLNGKGGADEMRGGAGEDTYYVDNSGDLVIELPGQGDDLVNAAISYTLPANVERLTLIGKSALNGNGNSLDNSVTGNGAANRLSGKEGKDLLEGLGGADTLDGGPDEDTASYSASPASVTVSLAANPQSGGDAAGDRLVAIEDIKGSRFADRLTGNAGANTLAGGFGADIISGGPGGDVFAYGSVADSPAAKPDLIQDFRASEGDRIDLTAIDAKSLTLPDDAFSFIGSRAFSGVSGQLRFASGRLEGDVNGDRKADIVILLKAVTSLPVSAIRR
ncbi:RCC1 domain-containing protein [Oryzibacter oryziterrae]|uniref:RCC1 domain-containing protein n=1 Tax=Oryzibacter oryziterrae TaxID=2766474 RepID=UPI001F2D674E|nr:HYR domain-containing protein [Oryzibacter oryziterrae]